MTKKILLLLLAISMVGCATRKEIVYFQDIKESGVQIPQPDSTYDFPEIQVNDILKIDITALNEEAILPFQFDKLSSRTGNQSVEMMKLQGYVVGQNGTINYPIVGEIKALGKTTAELQTYMEEILSTYIKNPSVRVRLLNFKVTILGEVKSPGVLNLSEESITLPQAIGMAGNLTIQGKRNNVLIIRTVDGERTTKRIDLRKTDWMDSPYYYLKQNDVIYVEPNNPKVASAGFIGTVGTVLSVFSILLSTVLLLTR